MNSVLPESCLLAPIAVNGNSQKNQFDDSYEASSQENIGCYGSKAHDTDFATTVTVSSIPCEVDMSSIKIRPDLQMRLPNGSLSDSQRMSLVLAETPGEESRPVWIISSKDKTLDGVLIAGNARYQAAMKRKDKFIQAIFVKVNTLQEAKIQALIANSRHGVRLKGSDLGEFALELSKKMSYENIGKLYGLDKSTVSRQLAKLRNPSPAPNRCNATNTPAARALKCQKAFEALLDAIRSQNEAYSLALHMAEQLLPGFSALLEVLEDLEDSHD